MMKMKTAKALGAAALGISALAASTAFANAPGNTVDKDGCEVSTTFNVNFCGTGPNHLAVQGSSGGFNVANQLPGVPLAYATLHCSNGAFTDPSTDFHGTLGTNGTITGQGGNNFWNCLGGLPVTAICGSSSACAGPNK